ncbi:cation efflux family protein [Natronoflexus pectinivorans]|uniref:Cation efflux family protein n=2 Tax=Natronoflexus pectinivorans TaxID=682526 RepID=A0A4R2GJK3_9BACT|nr:cation efflux family protein [Natronoflexus pectinivorans]
MDCPSEEQMIRMTLDNLANIKSLEFDIPNRFLHVIHTDNNEQIFQRLEKLKLDTTIFSTVFLDNFTATDNQNDERKTLWTVLIINFLFFAIEIITGFISNSIGLVADSLDMLADSIVYGLALIAVGGTVVMKKNIAKFAGYFQIILALIGFIEVIRRFFRGGEMPDFQTMIFVSVAALIANVICLYLLQKRKSEEAHMQASMIFTSNDIIINSGVIMAGLMVNWLNSGYPDLIIGAIIFAIVARGAYRILQLSK